MKLNQVVIGVLSFCALQHAGAVEIKYMHLGC